MLLPLKVDVPTWRVPWMNYLLIAAIVIVSLMGFADADFFRSMAGIQGGVSIGAVVIQSPHMTNSAGGMMLAALTSMFMHGGFIHLLGNMWFLWVFGNAINYKFGQLAYLGLFLVAGWGGTMLEYAMNNDPVVGASGAINGIVGAFLVLFPRNDVTVGWIWGIWGNRFSLSSGWVILYWVIWDAAGLALGAKSGVALWAHLGGFAIGFGITMACVILGFIRPTQDEETLLQVLSPTPRRGKYY